MMKIKQKNTLTKQKNSKKGNDGITLIALVVTIQVNCSCVAMERKLKKVNNIEKIKDL